MIIKIIAAGLIAGLLSSGMVGIASAEQSIKLFGYITEDADAPVRNSCVTVSYSDQSGASFKNTHTDENGYYELTVPYHSSFEFFVEGREYGDPYLFNYIPTRKNVFVDKPADVQVDFRLKPGANIIVHAYDSNGNLLRNKDFREVTLGEAVATNPDNLPHYAPYNPIHDSYSISKSNWDLAIPAFIVLPQTPYKIHILWEVPGFGKVILSADNEGDGYSPESQGEELILNFNYEVAKSKVAMLQRDYELLKSQGYSISGSVVEGLNLGKEHLEIAEQYLVEDSDPDMKNVVEELNLSLKHSLLALEQLYLNRAEPDIEKYRKGAAKIKVVGEAGEPVGDCSISFKQTSHEFVFSADLGMVSYSELMKQARINYVYSYFHYGTIEPEVGRFGWGKKDREVRGRLDKGLKLIGMLGWLFSRPSWAGGDPCPRYLDDMSFEEVKEAVYNHMYTIADRYKGKIYIWNAVYEPCAAWANEFGWTWNQKFEIFKVATSAIKDANPEAKILSKDWALPYTRYMSWTCYEPAELDSRAEWIPWSEFITLATKKGVTIDIIGLELPSSGVISREGHALNMMPALNLVGMSTLLDQYTSFGKPIFIIDWQAPSTQVQGSCWWHRPWDEQTQAEYLEQVYTIAFSKPLVKGIVWGSGVVDSDTATESCGLFDADFNPKPAYFALKNLINSWRTDVTGKTDGQGEFEFRGFAGEYEVTLETAEGRSFETIIHINEQQTNEITIEFPLDIRKEPKLIQSFKPEEAPSSEAAPITEEEPSPAAVPIPEEEPSSGRNNTPLIAGTIVGIVVLGLLILFVVRKRAR